MAEREGAVEITFEFLESIIEFSATDQKRLVKAARFLRQNEAHPSLRVHELSGEYAGVWSASASDDLRILFVRAEGGKKVLMRCTRHYR